MKPTDEAGGPVILRSIERIARLSRGNPPPCRPGRPLRRPRAARRPRKLGLPSPSLTDGGPRRRLSRGRGAGGRDSGLAAERLAPVEPFGRDLAVGARLEGMPAPAVRVRFILMADICSARGRRFVQGRGHDGAVHALALDHRVGEHDEAAGHPLGGEAEDDPRGRRGTRRRSGRCRDQRNGSQDRPVPRYSCDSSPHHDEVNGADSLRYPQ